MRLVRYSLDGSARLGLVKGDMVIDLKAVDADAPDDLVSLLELDESRRLKLLDLADKARTGNPIGSIKIELPIGRPGKFLCLGLNYIDHVAESTLSKPDYPTLFMRAPTSLVAHGEAIVLPKVSEQLDYEAELCVIIGRTLRHVSPQDALAGVAGYTCFNDGSVRDYQRHTVQWTVGKNFDRTGGFGPIFVTADELPSGAAGLKIETRVNGETRQSNNTANMIFGVAETVSYVSKAMTLRPGDVIAMGTPSGVAAAHKPPKWLKKGDRVEVEIERIGILRNEVSEEEDRVRPAAA